MGVKNHDKSGCAVDIFLRLESALLTYCLIRCDARSATKKNLIPQRKLSRFYRNFSLTFALTFILIFPVAYAEVPNVEIPFWEGHYIKYMPDPDMKNMMCTQDFPNSPYFCGKVHTHVTVYFRRNGDIIKEDHHPINHNQAWEKYNAGMLFRRNTADYVNYISDPDTSKPLFPDGRNPFLKEHK